MGIQGAAGKAAAMAGAKAGGQVASGVASGAGMMGGLQGFGNMMSIAGGLVSTIGAYFAADSQRYAARSEALNLEFQSSIAGINAELAERNAAAAIRAGRQTKFITTLNYGQEKARVRALQGASGLQRGVGSAAETMASIELSKTIEAGTIDLNTVRAVNAARMEATDLRNRALLGRVSAHNLRTQANNISPWLAATNALIGAAGPAASNIVRQGGRS